MKKLLSLLLALTLCLGSIAFAEAPEATVYQPGDKIADFTITTFDGKTVTLSDVLKEKEAVLINIWATWCGPCRNEFPYLEEAYELYKDQVEVIALSCEPTDTPDVLTEFVADMGLTFPVGQDTLNLSALFAVDGIPTSIIVDRFGTICFIEVGSQPSAEAFTRLFDLFLGDSYTESVVIDGVPKMVPNVAPSSEADLSAALNVEGGNLVFTNGTDEYDWPMIVGEKDGRSVAVSSNTGIDESEAKVNTAVAAKAGDAIVVTFKVSCEAVYDLMQLRVNGETVKSFGGEKDWMTYAYAVPADGVYTVTLAYVKDQMQGAGEDTLWVDSIAVLSGSAATEALAANPVYPVADEFSFTVMNEGAKQIVIDDPIGDVQESYGDLFYLIPGETAAFELALPADCDPETAYIGCNYDGSAHALCDCLTDGKYVVSFGCDSVETTGYSDSSIYVYASTNVTDPLLVLTYFKNEENVNSFVANMCVDENDVVVGSWTYADGTAPSTTALPSSAAEISYDSAYTVKYVDQDGNPVAGVMCQVCDDATCQVFVSDTDGICEFVLAPYAWEIHTLKVPDGYEGDTETITTAPVEGGELTFTLKKL